MRILFATTRGAGHFGPLVPFARAALRARHDVLVAGPPGAGPLAERAVLPFRALPEPPEDELAAVWAPVASLEPDAANEYVVREVFARTHARAALPGMLAAIEELRPDAVVAETCEFSSVVAADRLGVPHARVGVFLSTQSDDWALEYAAPVLDEMRDGLGLAPDPRAKRARRSPLFSQAPRSLEQAPAPATRLRDPGDGPHPPLPDWWAGDRDPLVYVSFGSEVPTTDLFPGLYRGAVDALAGLPVRVLVTVGDTRDAAELGPLPASVHVERWVPQAAVMPHAAAMVGHGGAGSTLTALAGGVPLAIVPLFADQPDNARRVAERGAGVALEGGPPAVPGLKDAVRALLEEPAYGAAAKAVADEIRALPPVDRAIAMLATPAGRRASAA